jgi:tetratricopeptide (TPR) repeat protein
MQAEIPQGRPEPAPLSRTTRSRRASRLLAATCAALALLATPSLAADDSLSRGTSALEAGRYREAEIAFRDALKADPESAQAHYLLGLARSRRGDDAGAAESFERALEIDPELPGARLSLGIARYELDDFAGAERALRRSLAADAGDADAHHFLGLALQKQGKVDDALHHFESAARLDPSYRQLAFLQAGVAQREAGNSEAAREAFDRAIALNAASETGRHAHSLRESLSSEIVRRKRWSLSGRMGMEADDNVSVPELDASSGKADVAGVFDAGIGFRFLEGPGYEAEGSYDFYQSVYTDISGADLQSHTLALSGLRELGPFDAGLDYRFTLSRLGGDGFLDVHEVFPSFGFSPRSPWHLTVGYDFQAKDFRIDDARDADQHALAVRSFFLLGDASTSLALIYRLEGEDANAAEFDYRGQVAGARFETAMAPFDFDLELELGYRFAFRDYANATPSIGERREDRRHRFDIAVDRKLTELLTARLAYQYFRSSSNLPEADYDNNLLNLGLGIAF